MNSTTKNVLKSSVGNLANQAVRSGQQLLWVPLFLGAFGAEGYGEWLTLFGLAGSVAMADVGIQIYWLNLLTRAQISGDTESYKRIFRSGLFLVVLVAGLAFPVALAFSLADGPSRTLGLQLFDPDTASLVFMVLVASTLLSVVSRMLRGVFRTVGQAPKMVWFELAREALIFALVAMALLLGAGPLGLAWIYGGIAVLMVAWSLLTVRTRFAELLDFRLHNADHKTVSRLVGGGSVSMASVLSHLLLLQGTLIITNWALGAAAVALIAASRTLANLMRQMASSVCNATLPEFSRLEADGDDIGMRKLLRRSTSFVMLFSGLAAIGLLGLGPMVFNLWTGGRFENAAPLIYLFAASVMVDSVRLPLNIFLLGCNRIAWVALTNLLYAVSSLFMMWALFPSVGASAVPLATMLCGTVLHLPTVALGSSSILGGSFVIRLLVRTGSGLFLAGVCALPVAVIAKMGDQLTWVIGLTVLSLAAFASLFWLVLLNGNDAQALKRMVKGRFVRTRP